MTNNSSLTIEPHSETFDSVIIQESNHSTSNSNIEFGLITFLIEIDLLKSICRIVLVSIVSLYLFIAVVILTFKRLHNVIWLGVIVCNLLTLFTVIIEHLAYPTQKNNFRLCYVSIMGVGYTCLLCSLFLALGAHCAAIVHPLSHREKVIVYEA